MHLRIIVHFIFIFGTREWFIFISTSLFSIL
jgi:hypothetical protein